MPQTKIDNRCYSQPRKCDAPVSNFVTFEIKDESSPESSPPFNSFFRGQPSKSDVRNICNGRKTEDNVTYSGLSILSNNCNQEDTNNNCDLDLHPSNLLNGHSSKDEIVNAGSKNNCYIKNTLFSDSLLDSLTSKSQQDNSMKIIDDSVTQVTGDFSDLLSSISLPENALKKFSSDSNFNLSNVEVSDKHSVDFELFKTTSSSFDSLKVNGFTNQSNGSLSDILSSISFDENDPSMQNGQKSSPLSEDSNLCYKENQLPILKKLNPEFFKLNSQTSDDSSKQYDSESNNGTLSDILSSISFDGIGSTSQNGFKSFSNSNMCLDDIKVPVLNELNPEFSTLNTHSDCSKLKTSELGNNGTLSDMLSSISFPEKDTTMKNGFKSAAFFSSDPRPCLENESSRKLKKLSSEHLKLDDEIFPTNKSSDNEVFNFSSILNDTNFNIQTTSSSESNVDDKTIPMCNISILETTDLVKSSINDEKNGEFSFFNISPDNVFSNMLANLNKTSDSQDDITNENSADMSMLDLLKSVNTDSNGSLSGYLSTPSKSEEIKNGKEPADIVFDDLNEIPNIDLSACIKTSDDSLNNILIELPVNKVCIDEKDHTEIKLEDFMKPIFDNVDSFGPKRPRMNLNQSLFAKSLSCKPKKNRILLQKVAQIKSKLCEHYFSHSVPGETEMEMQKNIDKEIVTCIPNTCMITFKGRRFCPQEVH